MKLFKSFRTRRQNAGEKPQKEKNPLLQTYLTSLLCLVLCVTMFFGTTFAWFTSEVTNTGNEIYIGTLDVGLFKVEGETQTDLNGSDTKLFDGSILWEPGYTAIETIRIVNEGELALRYVLNFTDGATAISEAGTASAISDQGIAAVAPFFSVFVYQHKNGNGPTAESYNDITAENSGWVSVGTLDALLAGAPVLDGTMGAVSDTTNKENHTYSIALHMNGNAPASVMGHAITLNVKLTAYQMASEHDAFGNTYDMEAFAGTLAQVTELEEKSITYQLGIDGSGESEPMTLDTAYQFLPNETLEEAEDAPYANWHADFVVWADKEVPANSMALAGYYKAWCSLIDNKWVALSNEGMKIDAWEEIRLVQTLGASVSYKDICQFGNDGIGFLCGAADLTGTNAGTTITVELRMYETDESLGALSSVESETGRCITVGTFTYTFPETGSGQ